MRLFIDSKQFIYYNRLNLKGKNMTHQNDKVLIVDHISNSRNTIKKILTTIGYNAKNISMVTNSSLASNALCESFYDLVVCEYNLGNGKNGQQLLEYLKHHKILKEKTIFLIISAECSEAVVLSAVDEGPDGYIAKPFSSKELDSKLKRIKEEKSLFSKIDKIMKEKDIDKALLECENILLENPQYMSKILKYKSEILLNNNRLEEAFLLYRTLIQSNPKSQIIALQYSKILIKLGKYDIAKKKLIEITKKNKRLLEAYDLLEKISIKENDNKERQKILEDVSKISPLSGKRQKKLGEVAEKNGDLETAYAAYSSIVKKQEHSVINDEKLKLKWVNLQVQKSLKDNDSKNIEISFENLKNYKNMFKSRLDRKEIIDIMFLDLEFIIINKKSTYKDFVNFYDEYERIIKNSDSVRLDILEKLREKRQNQFCDYIISKMDKDLFSSQRCQKILSDYKGNKRGNFA